MRLLTILFSIFFLNAHCQDVTKYTAIYNKTYLETSQKDFNKALKVADSLYSISETPVIRARSLMLSATLYSQSGEFDKSLEYALKAKNIIETTDNAIAKAKIYGFLATHSRYVWLLDDSKKYTELGIDASKNIVNPDVSNNVLGQLMQEMAYYHIELKNYNKAIEKIGQAKSNFDKSKTSNTFQIATNEQLLGDCYYSLGNIDKSFFHYQHALDLLKSFPENYQSGLVHKGLVLFYLKKGDLSKAREHLNIAQRIADESNYLSLKKEVYAASESYYATTKNLDDYIKTKEKQDTIKKKLDKNVQSFVTKTYNNINRQNREIKKNDSFKNATIIVILILIVLSSLLFVHYRKRQKKSIENFKKILKDIDEKQRVIFSNDDSVSTNSYQHIVKKETEYNKDGVIISEATTKKILEKLREFENSHDYTNNNISLSFLATYCETNTKYLSTVLNTNRKKDFHNYINDLRIDYIVQKLRNDPQYRKYKIAILAEEAGFSSHAKFSLIFKKNTSLTPSVFIKRLENSEHF